MLIAVAYQPNRLVRRLEAVRVKPNQRATLTIFPGINFLVFFTSVNPKVNTWTKPVGFFCLMNSRLSFF